jgi:hypothetical protein
MELRFLVGKYTFGSAISNSGVIRQGELYLLEAVLMFTKILPDSVRSVSERRLGGRSADSSVDVLVDEVISLNFAPNVATLLRSLSLVDWNQCQAPD